MRWMYRLQQRIALTRSECNVILALAVLFCVGLAARYVQSRARPVPAVAYAEAERLFQEASEAALADTVEQASPASTVEPSSTPTAYQPKSALAAGSINLNTATASELQRLPRIGPKLAARILAHREAHGPFRRVQDLLQVSGIGKKTLARLEPYLIVEAPQE